VSESISLYLSLSLRFSRSYSFPQVQAFRLFLSLRFSSSYSLSLSLPQVQAFRLSLPQVHPFILSFPLCLSDSVVQILYPSLSLSGSVVQPLYPSLSLRFSRSEFIPLSPSGLVVQTLSFFLPQVQPFRFSVPLSPSDSFVKDEKCNIISLL
jgi:hypothetical protein